MAHEMSQMKNVGSKPVNQDQSDAAEQEYDRLRDLARQEADKRGSCFERSKQAYNSGDGAQAHALSEEGKQHGAAMERYNKQASEFIFRENNADGRVPEDSIDLHGQFVEEAEDILEERIRQARSTGQTHLHVIVGKGNHSTGHVQKIKPRVEQMCQREGIQYHTEANAGRMYLDLTGGNAPPPSGWAQQPMHPQQPQQQQNGGHGQQHGGAPYQNQNQHPTQPQNQNQNEGYNQGQAQEQKYDEAETPPRKLLPRIMRKMEQNCCTIM